MNYTALPMTVLLEMYDYKIICPFRKHTGSKKNSFSIHDCATLYYR